MQSEVVVFYKESAAKRGRDDSLLYPNASMSMLCV
jgi:hypothetical protein